MVTGRLTERTGMASCWLVIVAWGRVVCVASCFLNHDFQDRLGVGFIMTCSWAVILSVGGCGLALDSVSSTTMCVGWLTVADVRPGPLT